MLARSRLSWCLDKHESLHWISELALLIMVQMPFTAFSPALISAFSLAVTASSKLWILPMIRVEASLLLLVEVSGWAVVGGECWVWVGVDVGWDWLVGELRISFIDGKLCWCFSWAMVEDGSWTWVGVSVEGRFWVWVEIESCWWFEVVATGLVSVEGKLWAWVGIEGC